MRFRWGQADRGHQRCLGAHPLSPGVLMDVRRSKRRGSIFDLTVFETDLCVRVDWECLEHESVADLDLSCAIYDRKVGVSCSRTFCSFSSSYLSPFVRACDAGDLSGPRASHPPAVLWCVWGCRANAWKSSTSAGDLMISI